MDHVLLPCPIMQNERRGKKPDVERDAELEQGVDDDDDRAEEELAPTEEELLFGDAAELPIEESGGESEYSLTQARRAQPGVDDDVEGLPEDRGEPPREEINLAPDGVDLARHTLEEATEGRMTRRA